MKPEGAIGGFSLTHKLAHPVRHCHVVESFGLRRNVWCAAAGRLAPQEGNIRFAVIDKPQDPVTNELSIRQPINIFRESQ